MKKIAFAICLLLSISACSSGTSVSEVPPTITGLYSGPFESSNGALNGRFILNLVENSSNMISGTMQVEFSQAVDGECIQAFNNTISGSISGFNVRLTADTRDTTTTPGNGENPPTESADGEITFQLTASGDTLDGTYVTTGVCSDFSGTGNVRLTR